MIADPLTAAVAALLVAGIVGSFVPFVPGPAISLAGIGAYWWATGFQSPSVPVLVTVGLLATVAIAIDLFGGAIAAKGGGASATTVVAAVIAAVGLALFTGPLGLLIGVPLAVFLLEYRRSTNVEDAGWTAVVTVVGILASNVVQALLSTTIFVAFGLAVWF